MSSPQTARAFVALGANIDGPEQRVRECARLLDAEPFGRVRACSSLYRSAPVGKLDQPDFINAVLELATALSPLALMQALLDLETRLGRVRGERNGPRRIDLDLIAFDARQLATVELQLPPPRAATRAFVLLPFNEIAPDWMFPTGGVIAELTARLSATDIQRIGA